MLVFVLPYLGVGEPYTLSGGKEYNSVFDNGYSALSLGPTVRHDDTFHQRQVLFVKKIQTGQVWLYRDPVLSRIINYT